MKEYDKILKWLFKQLPMYQRVGKAAYKADISNTVALCEHLSNPQKKIRTVHVAGTNGKGSSSHMIASVLQEAGFKTGLYTSPHLKDFRERIKINGELIPEQDVIDFVEGNKNFFKRNNLSFFEMTVGMAFDYFAKNEVDIAVIETGLGGRLDSTNVIKPMVSLITNIGLDHTAFLGETHVQIATEKAGIIKDGVPVVIGQTQSDEITEVFRKKAASTSSEIYFADELDWIPAYKTDLKGKYQVHNIRSAVACIKVLQLQGEPISEENISNGLLNVVYNTGLLGRWQQLLEKPYVVCDTAHNKEGIELVVEQILSYDYDKLRIVLGMVSDKNISGVLDLLPKDAEYYFCQAAIPRAMDVEILKSEALLKGLKGKSYPSVREAYARALEDSSENDMLFIGGSTFVVAEVV